MAAKICMHEYERNVVVVNEVENQTQSNGLNGGRWGRDFGAHREIT
jgi:hypothetical protein